MTPDPNTPPPPLPEQPLATVDLSYIVLGALAGRGNDTARLAAQMLVVLALDLEAHGHVLDRAWCTSTYLRLHRPVEQATRLAPPKAATRRRGSVAS